MATRIATRLESFLKRRTDGNLRSIVKYEEGHYEVVFLRADVANQYTEREIEEAVNESIMESITVPIYEDAFSDEHGDLTCLVQCFENVIEMNFILSDGAGVAVAMDVEAFSETAGLVADARELVVEGQDCPDRTRMTPADRCLSRTRGGVSDDRGRS